MRKTFYSSLILLGLLLSFNFSLAQFSPAPAQEGVVYILYGENLGTLDPATGAITLIGAVQDVNGGTPTRALGSIAINSQGEMFGLGNTFLPGNPPDLVQIDPATGMFSVIGAYIPAGGTSGIKGMAFDANDVLYGAEWAGNGKDISTINTADASNAVLYDDVLPSSWYGGMEYRESDGLMYISDWTFKKIHTVDPATGAYNEVFSGDATPGHFPGDLFFDENDDLFVATGSRSAGPSLWKVDLVGGTTTKIAQLTAGVKAITTRPGARVDFTLINARTDQPVPGFDPIPEGANIDLSMFGSNPLDFNIRANVPTDGVSSVKMVASRQGRRYSNTESRAPYALFRNSGSNYFPADFRFALFLLTTNGSINLRATACDSRGDELESGEVNFTMSLGGAPLREFLEETALNVHPNPSNGEFIVSGELGNINGGSIRIFNTVGQEVFSQQVGESFTERVNLSSFAKGLYIVKLEVEGGSLQKKLILE